MIDPSKTYDPGSSNAAPRSNASWASCLFVASSPDTTQVGRVIPLHNTQTLGRGNADGVDVIIDDPRMSRRHATFRPHAGSVGAEVIDSSSHGTFADSVRVSAMQVGAGTVIRLGDTVLVLDALTQPRTSRPIARSGVLCEVLARLDKVAKSDLPVLLLGESGTGKDELARYVHSESKLGGAYVAINCAAIPPELAEATLFGHKKGAFTGAAADNAGYFAAADGGTLFLDEVGELRPDLQGKLLRVLENREFTPVGSTVPRGSTARVLAATNANLLAAVERGSFRRDLYARLAGLVVRVPPLRQRRADIPDLLRFFLSDIAPEKRLSLSANVIERVLLHPWPLNVRELRSVAQRLVLFAEGDQITSALLAEAMADGSIEPGEVVPAVTETDAPPREELAALLTRHRGNVAEVARHYGKHRKQIYRWLEARQLRSEDFRG